MSRPPARRPSRRSSGSNTTSQLSFFDAAGELVALQRQERQLRAEQRQHDDHRHFLAEAVEAARRRVGAAQDDLQRAERQVGEIEAVRLSFHASIAAVDGLEMFTDRAAAGAASWKDKGVASAKVIETTGAVPVKPPAGPRVPPGDPPPANEAEGEGR